MRMMLRAVFMAALIAAAPGWLAAQQQPAPAPASQVIGHALARLVSLIEPGAAAPAQTFTARLRVTRAEGLPEALRDASLDLAFQAPDRILLKGRIRGEMYTVGRHGQQAWVHVPGRGFGMIGAPGVLRFAEDPNSIDRTELAPVKLPMSATQLMFTALLLPSEARPAAMIGGERCHVVAIGLPENLLAMVGLPAARAELAVRQSDDLPARIRFWDGKQVHVEVQVEEPALGAAWAEDRWWPQAGDGERMETVALSHLMNFADVAISNLSRKIPSLGAARGERKLIASTGQGRLEEWDGTRVLFLKGTPEAMGRQHGTLLKNEVRDVARRILYGVGVGSSFAKGRWFFGEIESAQRRLLPHISERYLAEMDALARAAGMERQEMRLANFFPELFHCSGFAISGEATVGGRLYHGRVLDYLRGVGLEQNAVVAVYQPDEGNAWVNVGYAGFTGSVTAMNEKQIAIGEMGGRGEGNWDGKPMAQLVREVMERADTLEEAIEIMRAGPRTCEYYYVISDGKSRRAVAIRATPDEFETVFPGESHRLLPHAVKDAVLLSADARYEKLVERVKLGYGKLDVDGARALMEPPVCMSSNIHSVLFAPETLDFWVANADSQNVAGLTRYTYYNLAEMLKGPAAK